MWNYANGDTVIGSNDVESAVFSSANTTLRGTLDVAGTSTLAGNVELSGTSGQHLKFADDSGSSWSGNHAKIQHHNSYMYLQGGSSGIILRTNSGTNAFTIDSSANINFNNAYTFPTSIGSAGQVLKVPSSGTTLEWGTGGGGSSNSVTGDFTITDYEAKLTLTKTRNTTQSFHLAHENDDGVLDFLRGSTRTARITNNGRWVIGGHTEVNSSALSVNGTFGVDGTSQFGGIITSTISSGTIMTRGGFSDFIGYNASYGTYIGGGASNAVRYIYAGGYFYDGSTVRTLLHSGNVGYWENESRNFWFRASVNTTGQGFGIEKSDGTFQMQLYGDGTNQGFLTGQWASWDLKKIINGQLNIRVGGSYYDVWHAGNDGSGSGLDADLWDGNEFASYLNQAVLTTSNPTFNQIYANDWFRVNGSDGIYWQDYGGGWRMEDTTYLRVYGSKMVYLTNGTLVSGPIRRADHVGGWLEGSYNNVASNDAKSNPIYTIGSSYNPTNTGLSNMYGIGFAHGNFWGSGSGKPNGWGLYAASAGTIRCILDGDNGIVWASNSMKVGTNTVVHAGNYTSYQVDTNTNFPQTGQTWTLSSGYSVAMGDWGLRNTTPYGYIQFGPANSSHAHIYTDRSNFYFNVNTLYANGNLMWTAGNDGSGSGLDADVLDGYHGSNYIGKNGNTYYRPNTWINMASAGNAGLYWSNNGWHFYPKDAGAIYVRSGNSSYCQLELNANGTTRGMVYADSSNQVGFLTSAGSWTLRCAPDSSDSYSYNHWLPSTNNGLQLGNSSYKWSRLYVDNLYVSGNTYGSYNVEDGGNTWAGITYSSHSSKPTIMFKDVHGDGGLYHQGSSSWRWYYAQAHGCIGLNGSTTSSSYGCYITGSVYTTGSYNSSDIRLKENIETIDSAIDKVMKMRGVYFDWINKEKGEGRQVGVIAQEMNEVLPEAVIHAKDIDEYTVDYAKITGVLIEAIKDLKNEINELKKGCCDGS